ncbi:DEP domain-containing protein 1A-like isoform X2 [Macrobrachium nipponense]|uniref:DEP domain-containing protein 1A-like isoform X2 n=1 Tax=Macrobrachium nipponense TaxID=159736 RepID=UPI0030C8460C
MRMCSATYWNDAVRGFYNGMPVSRHWRGLRQYERCFTASEAIDWLHVHLKNNPNFGSSVSREQTTKLLRKFVKAGLIEDIHGSSSQSENFKDNRDLYRFCNKSPLKALRTPRTPGRIALGTLSSNNPSYVDANEGASPELRKRWDNSPKQFQLKKLDENVINEAKDNGGMQKCHVVTKPLTKEETNNVWKWVFMERLDAICKRLLFGDLSTLLDPSVINGEILHHNMTQITVRGVVQAPEGHPDNLPNWILTAMKCMAHWPNAADATCNIPNYPGVERDVFKIVRDFFTNLVVPLVPCELYDAVIRLYIGAEFLDIACRSSSSDGKSSVTCKGNEGSYIHNNLEGSDSVENLILNMSISSQQKTSTPCLETGGLAYDANNSHHSKTKMYRRVESEKKVGSELYTPVLPHKDFENLSNPQSLKLQKLKNYTDFKEDNLYPTLLEGSCETSSLGLYYNNLDKSKNGSFPAKVFGESVVSKQAETVRSVKTNDLARRMKKENKETAVENFNILKSNEIEGFSLPQNCCFETAFTSDSPKTRIIPQKSVDTVHLKDRERNIGNSRPRPVSIAVTSLAGLDVHSSDIHYPWDTTMGENMTDALDMMSKSSVLSSTVSGKYVTAPINSPLSRSRSAGNLRSLVECNTSQKPSESPAVSSNPYKSLANRLLDSVKRKSSQNTSICQKQINHNRSLNEKHSGSKIRHLRTKSGGYMNPVLVTGSDNDEVRSIQSYVSDKENNPRASHFRTKSGGFLNLALAPLQHSVDQMDSFETISSAPTVNTDLSLHDGIPTSNSQCSSYHGYCKPTDSANQSRSRISTPDGCLSHVLSSSSSIGSSGNSIYYSVCSHASRNNTPTLPDHPFSERGRRPIRDSDSVCSSHKAVGNEASTSSADVELSKRLSLSANELSDGWADRTPYGQVPPYAQGGVWRHYHSSPSKRLIGRKRGTESFFGSKACLPGLLTREGKEAAITSIQLMILMLEPVRRRKLHLLLRMMKKMSHNEKLAISDKQTTRAMVLDTFTRSILLCSQEADYDELLSLRIVSFMMDNHEEIMRPPQDMAVVVHRKLTQMQRSQIVYDSTLWDRSMTLTYCQQVSQEQYERQRLTGSQQFLVQLLDQILMNDKLSNKEKRKKLKEFKSLYPEVYKERCPQEAMEKTENRSLKFKNLMKFSSFTSLRRRRTLRL